MKEDYTIHEHYIPRVLLRGFSPNYNGNKTRSNKKNLMVWRYDCKTHQSAIVPEDSVCVIDNLYESTGTDGKFVFRNLIEKKLANIEIQFERFRAELEQKAFNYANLNTKCFLRKKEKDFWALFITHLIFRNPEVIGEVAPLTQGFSEEELTKEEKKNLALMICTPYYRPLDETTCEAIIMEKFLSPLRELNFQVAVSKTGRFVTSDKAVFVSGNIEKNGIVKYNYVLFPVTAFLCLILSKKETKQGINSLVYSNEPFERELFQALKVRGNEIFSRFEIKENYEAYESLEI